MFCIDLTWKGKFRLGDADAKGIEKDRNGKHFLIMLLRHDAAIGGEQEGSKGDDVMTTLCILVSFGVLYQDLSNVNAKFMVGNTQ